MKRDGYIKTQIPSFQFNKSTVEDKEINESRDDKYSFIERAIIQNRKAQEPFFRKS